MADESLGNLQDKQLLLEKQLKAKQDIGAAESEILAIKKEQLAVEEAISAKLGGADQDYITKLERRKKALKELTEEQERSTSSYENFNSALKNNIKSLTGVEDASKTLVGSFLDLYARTGDLGEVFSEAGKTFKETFNTLDVGTSIARKFIESSVIVALEVDAGTAAFNRATGAGGKYNSQIQAAEKTNRKFGLSIAEISQARQVLADQLAGFGILQAEEQSRLIDLTAQFGRLGVSADEFTGILQQGTKALGLNTREVAKAAERIRKFGQAIGVSTAKIMSEFNDALPSLSSFGDQAEEVFKHLQKISQQTGIATGELISFGDQFMTIEGSAKAIAGLESVLQRGLGIDQMTLLRKANVSQAEVFEYIQDALERAGATSMDLDRSTRDALANALGVNEQMINQMLNRNEVAVERNQQETEFNEALKAGIGLVEQGKILAKELAVSLQPIMKIMTGVMSTISAVLGGLPASAKAAIVSTAAIGGAMAAMARIGRGASPANPLFVSGGGMGGMGGPGGGKGGGGGTMFGHLQKGKKAPLISPKLGFGLGMGATFAGGALESKGYEKTGGALSGAGKGAMIGSMIPGVGTVGGAIIGGIGGALGFFEEGGGVGGNGPKPAVVHGGEVVVPVEETPAAKNLSSMIIKGMMGPLGALIPGGRGGPKMPGSGATIVKVYIGNEELKNFITKTQNMNLGRAPNTRPVGDS